ncbi:histone-lysine N-methyltransferase PRDM9-like [Mugil cephalus]|uniref:histone-lysine N-methyltransferase PRDM9-like n=1 Tax=Mugil cephalus TaxID=48193 RepID=UPI001FB82640|nr:histone-lysine N-methyltransferase PRDM9-like [Mugil cephalus]XP_047464597.1 histone-lysine N-methyltransferase PRDM9-like [Mugil cephalus]
MSGRSDGAQWVETTEEVVVIEECNTPTVIKVLESAETPIQKLLDAVGQGENAESGSGFYCEECLTLFQDQSDPDGINGPSFVLDFPTSVGVPERALLTLPFGLMIGRSSIPSAGVGVINHGPTMSPGMHFGPYEGEGKIMEDALASDYSWEIFKGKDQYEYIDAAKESHSNWMRYINYARNKDETNLLAVQYKGSILYHCCRTIHAGDELMVWPSSKLLTQFSGAWTQMWRMKLKAAENNISAASQIFQCADCRLSFTTESFLQRHAESRHSRPEAAADDENRASSADSDQAAASLALLSVNSAASKTCGDCGKTFKQIPHLRRHKLCVHSNKRPYCCPHCRRSFSQASGLIRHQLVHRKQEVDPDQSATLEEKESSTPVSESVSEKINEKENVEEEFIDMKETANTSKGKAETSQFNCSDCGKSFINETSLKKHKMTIHERIRPYVCAVCQKCFGQYNDLDRHLQSHHKQSKSPGKINAALPFSCAECSLTFSSVDALQQHISEHRSNAAARHGVDPETVESVQNLPPRRPQRLGARSKVSAITKLIAPKRRAASPARAESNSAEPEPPAAAARNGKLGKYKWFCCNRCKQTYGNPDDLKAHKCTLRQHKCGQCGATFSKTGFLKRHEVTAHAKVKSYSCDRCGKVFTTCGNLKQHQKSNTCMKYHCTSELFPCSFCQFSFTLKSYLIKHIKRHHHVEYVSQPDSTSLADQLEEEEEEDKGQKECPVCGKSCASTKDLKSHTCFRKLKVMYLCTDCGKGFTNHYGLKQHQRIHTGEKPYSCPHCSKSFSYIGQLNVHLRTHTGEKPYLCTHCGESFRQSGDLKRHERKHTGVRPYSCPECSKGFSRLQSLKAHQMLHQGQRMFKCTQCGKSFSRNYHLRRHHQKMHM